MKRNPLNRLKRFFWTQADDLKQIQDFFKRNGLTAALSEYNELGYLPVNKDTSMHFAIAYGLIQTRNSSSCLEIGTHDGVFSEFLSSIGNIEVTTVDLPESDDRFRNTYYRTKPDRRSKFIAERDKRLAKSNIHFCEFDSWHILKTLKDKKYDFIWVDGDHHAPQVFIDIYNAINMLSSSGVILVDDVIIDPYMDAYVSNDSFNFIKWMKARGIIEYDLCLKRVTDNNSVLPKYIAMLQIK